jgi:hypothetical protein
VEIQRLKPRTGHALVGLGGTSLLTHPSHSVETAEAWSKTGRYLRGNVLSFAVARGDRHIATSLIPEVMTDGKVLLISLLFPL